MRTKAKLLGVRYPGIRMLIVRRTYPELVNNHIRLLRTELLEVARYNDKDKTFTFMNGSLLQFAYCAKDGDLDRLQGVEFDIIFLDEATQLSEYQMKTITACLRGANDFPKRVYYTMNPGGQGLYNVVLVSAIQCKSFITISIPALFNEIDCKIRNCK